MLNKSCSTMLIPLFIYLILLGPVWEKTKEKKEDILCLWITFQCCGPQKQKVVLLWNRFGNPECTHEPLPSTPWPTRLATPATPATLTVKRIILLLVTSCQHSLTTGQPIRPSGLISARCSAVECNWILSRVLNAPSGATLSEHCWGLFPPHP